jgi:hypothetical protein
MGGGDDSWARSKRRTGSVKKAENTESIKGDICDIVDEGAIRSPNPDTVRGLEKYTRLALRVEKIRGTQVVVAVGLAGTIGAVDCQESDQLISCILARHKYTATVIRRQGGKILLSIRRDKK